MACAVFSNVTGSLSPGNAFLKASTYSGMDFSTATTALSEDIAISTGFMTGPLACSSTSGARPSQNCTKWPAALYTVGALRVPFCPLWPSDTRCPSTPYLDRSWQVLQDMSWFLDNLGS